MINLVKVMYDQHYSLKLYFSDNTYGTMDFSYLLKAKTVLTEALEDEGYFKTCFIDFGALCWKNGLELSAESLYLKLKDKGSLYSSEDVA